MQLLGAKRIRTTAYHPIANGMVERLNRQLKASLKAHSDPINWSDTLPLVLLGIRTALKEDLHCTAAELVYGTTLRLPGEFFGFAATSQPADPADFVQRLKTTMQQLQAPPVRPQQQRSSHIPNSLLTGTHAFVRNDTVCKPLQSPYDGPYKVLARSDKHFTLDIHGQRRTVSVDRLKPAHMATPTTAKIDRTPTNTAAAPPATTSPAIPPRVTRSGRHIRWPDRFHY